MAALYGAGGGGGGGQFSLVVTEAPTAGGEGGRDDCGGGARRACARTFNTLCWVRRLVVKMLRPLPGSHPHPAACRAPFCTPLARCPINSLNPHDPPTSSLIPLCQSSCFWYKDCETHPTQKRQSPGTDPSSHHPNAAARQIGSQHHAPAALLPAPFQGITVAEVTGSNVVSVAEHVVMMILSLTRNYMAGYNQVRPAS